MEDEGWRVEQNQFTDPSPSQTHFKIPFDIESSVFGV